MFYFLSHSFEKQTRDRQKEDSRPCYSLEHFFLFDSCECLYLTSENTDPENTQNSSKLSHVF